MVLGLVLVLAFGLVAIGERHPARAATGDSVVLAWNQQVVLDTIRARTGSPYRPPGDPVSATRRPGPTLCRVCLGSLHLLGDGG